MIAFVGAIAGWSLLVLGVVLFVPWDLGPLLDCMRTVGHPPECEARQEAMNQVRWAYQTLPMLVASAAGYAAIVLLRLTRVLRRRPSATSTPR
jgi:hypothetical protein